MVDSKEWVAKPMVEHGGQENRITLDCMAEGSYFFLSESGAST
jgi:hypothetical protein